MQASPHHDHARQPLADPHLFGPLVGQGVERAVPHQPGAGADGAVGGVRSADPDRLRLRSCGSPGRGGQGGRADLPSGRHGGAVRRHSARPHEHLDDHQRDGALAAGALYRGGGEAGRAAPRSRGHGAERHHQGVSLPRHLHLPAEGEPEADGRRHRLHLPRRAEMESDQHLLLSPAGGRRDAGAGAGLYAGDVDRRAWTRCRRRDKCRRKNCRR